MNCGRCNLTTCRYNFDHKYTDKRHRQECIEVKHSKRYMRDEYKRKIMGNVIE